MTAPALVEAGPPLPSARLRWVPAFRYWLSSYRRTWRASVFSGFLSPLLYLGSIGFGLGSLVDGGSGGLDGIRYVEFVAPGVLAATAMLTAFAEGSYPVLGAMIWARQYRAQVATPLTTTDVLVGHLVFVAFRILLAVGAFMAVAAALGAFRSWWVLLAPPVALLCGLAHAPAVMAYTVAQTTDAGLTILFRFGVNPMFLFAGAFFPIEQLPLVLRALARVTPVWHGTTVCRDLALGVASAPGVLGHVAYLLLWVAAGCWLAIRRYRRMLAS